MNLIKIENKEGQIVVSSRVIAEQLGKEHKNVLKDIREKSLLKFEQWIIPSKYRANNGQEYDEFLLTKDGFIMLVFNYDGYLEFKETYINEFNRMEKELNSKIKVPGTLKEALILALEQQEKIEHLEIENKIKGQQILEYKPKVEYLDTILNSQDTLTISQIAADYGISGKELNKILHENKIQHKIGGQWLLYTNHMNKGYTKSETKNIVLKDTTQKVIINTKWTQKGRIKIHELLVSLGIIANMDKKN